MASGENAMTGRGRAPEDLFLDRCLRGAEVLRKLLGRPRTEFLRMIGEHGAVGATKRLLQAPRASDTFTVRWEKGKLDLTMEWFVVGEPGWDPLFDDEDRRAAARRLRDYGCVPPRDF